MSKNEIKEQVDFTEHQKAPIKISVEDFLHTNGLEYSYYVIKDRALISEDGIKPVNRRILYGMHQMKLKPGSKKFKAAYIAGEVAGKYHPHGPSSVEGALARMGQSFNMRIPLLDYQGALGLVSGDTPASSRYWEASLNEAAWELVRDIDENACEMKYTETGQFLEPVNLPIRYPVGIILGTQGIAVGYSSTIPPHNPDEVLNACIAHYKGKLKNPKDVMKYIYGPDFPTGGVVIGSDGVEDYIVKGNGTFTLRGKYVINKLSRGRSEITFNELPYQISPEQIIKEIQNVQQKKGLLKDISEAKDLSDARKGLRLVIYLKSGSNPDILIEDLFKHTSCEVKFSVNNTILLNNKPNQNTSILTMIEQFNQFKKECYIRKTNYKITSLEKDLKKYEGLLSVLLDVDKAIKIIRDSDSAEIANKLLQKTFKIDEEQSNHILSMRLRQLTKADRNEIITKHKTLQEELNNLKNILNDESLLIKEIIKELEQTRKVISDPRRTELSTIKNSEVEELAKEKAKQERLLSKDVECYIHILEDNTVIKSLSSEVSEDVLVVDSFKTTSLAKPFVIYEDGTLKQITLDSLHLDTPTDLSTIGINVKDFRGFVDTNNFGTFIATNFGNVNITKNKGAKEGRFITLLPLESIIYTKQYNNEEDLIVNMLTPDNKVSRFPITQVRSSGIGSGTIVGNKLGCVSCYIGTTNDKVFVQSTHKYNISSSYEYPIKNRGGQGVMSFKLDKNESALKVFSANNLKLYLESKRLNYSEEKRTKGIKYNKKIRIGK